MREKMPALKSAAAAARPTPSGEAARQESSSALRRSFSRAANAGLLALALVAGCTSSASQNVGTNGAKASDGAPRAASATPATAPSPSAATSADKASDACALLTSDDIKGVQGEAVREAKSSRREDPNFRIGQCFYSMPTFTKSVSLEVTRRGDGAQSVREFWRANFERAEEKREAKNERRKKSGKPQAGPPATPIKGVGDEAYWVGTNANGTLYAFKQDALVRISIGGADDNAKRLDKARTLAQKALARL